MDLCELCKAINLLEISRLDRYSKSPQGRNQLPIGFRHHATYSALRSSATSCPSCKLFLESSDAEESITTMPKISESDCVKLYAITADQWPKRYILDRPSENAASLLGLKVEVGSPHSNSISYWKPLSIWAPYDSPDLLAADVLPRPVAPLEDASIISRWLSTCINHHRVCMQTVPGIEGVLGGDVVPLPTRVIDVFGSAKNGHQPFLHETNGSKGKFLALSHCWGTGPIVTTTSSNLESFKQSIPVDDICQNFRDAIFVTQRLGFQYLWIDSLCIIQGNSEDWENESSKMASVYNLSSLTLSAASASAAGDGFLNSRDPKESAKLPHYNRSGTLDGHYYLAPNLNDFAKEVENGPLNKQVWTLQERVLSRRNVFFGIDQCHWECQEAQWSESTNVLKQAFVDTSGGISALRQVLNLPRTADTKVYNLWYLLIREYTKRALTEPMDILPALSGIVSVFFQTLKADASNQYIAGLWLRDLARGLLWKSFGRTPEDQQKVRTPSWSWISHYGRIEPGRELKNGFIDIEDAEVDLKLHGKDPFGRVDSAKLTFTGCIKAIPKLERTGPHYQNEKMTQLYVYTNGLLYDEKNQKIGAAVLDEPNSVLPNPIYCVPIRHEQRDAGHTDVLLLRLIDSAETFYQRVGTAEMAKPNAKASPFQPFIYDAPRQRISII